MLGGQFAAWGICFSSFDCTFAHIRGENKSSTPGPLFLLNSFPPFLFVPFSTCSPRQGRPLELHHVWGSGRGRYGCQAGAQEHGGCSAVQCSIVQCSAVQYNTVRCMFS